MRAQTATLLLGPLAALAAWFAMLAGGAAPAAAVTLGVTVLCVLWWVFEPVPLPVTALVPLAVLPMFGVLSGPEVGQAYGHHVVLLLLGGFILSTAMERSGAHLRIAMGLVRAVGGGSSRRVVFGFMIASAALSMWISNTATTLMLLPVALAVLERTKDPKLAPALLLGLPTRPTSAVSAPRSARRRTWFSVASTRKPSARRSALPSGWAWAFRWCWCSCR